MSKGRFKVIASVYLVLIKENKLLLLLRKNTGFEDGNYGLVAGHLDPNETIMQAMVREAKEEAGIDINLDNLKLEHVLNRQELGNERLDFFFSISDWKGDIINNEPDKCGGLKWFDLDNLPNNIIDYIDQALKDIKNKNIYRETIKNEN
ncbi:MAG: NUDIX domain-containing protein [Patescibacteria group bacterium]|jgi:8-oxo-dGTP diphosphatase|nr:NUDIX domain-containing protein [Patescibacteria group bacterium]